MSVNHLSFPKIGSLKDCAKYIKNFGDQFESKIIPYKGTVKTHGTNASVRILENGNVICQSRNRILSLGSDNMNFAFFALSQCGESYWQEMAEKVRLTDSALSSSGSKDITIFGEWCGSGIQSGVAVSYLPKMFIVFAVMIGDETNFAWSDESVQLFLSEEKRIFNTSLFQEFNITIDFNDYSQFFGTLKGVVDSVEKECPVGKYFGVSGIGEGVVWRPVNSSLPSEIWFKTKGEEHKDTKFSSVKEEMSEDTKVGIERFIEITTTDHRLQKGLDFMKEMNLEISKQNTGKFIKWALEDILKEESNLLVESGISPGDVKSGLSNRIRDWYLNVSE